MANPVGRTIKVSDDLHKTLQQTVRDVKERGWKHLGLSRNDTPTFSNIIEESLKRLTNGHGRRRVSK